MNAVAVDIPAHGVVLVLGAAKREHERAAVAELCDRIPAIPCPWDVNKPEASLSALEAAMEDGRPVRVAMIRSNAKARRRVASLARKLGGGAIAVRLPGAEEIGDDEGFLAVHDVPAPGTATFTVVPAACDMRHLTGPFDFVGDVHGCLGELVALLVKLGYIDATSQAAVAHPSGRTLVLLGDLVDRGPENLGVLRLVQELEAFGALRVQGNHDHKVARWLNGHDVDVTPGIAGTITELETLGDDDRTGLGRWLANAQAHIVLDGGRVVAAHAGLPEKHHGSMTKEAQTVAMYGTRTGEIDEHGCFAMHDWALDYHGDAVVVQGHVVHVEPRIVGNVFAIDTGCCFGGRLTAFQWPERHFVHVDAKTSHATRMPPAAATGAS